MSGTSFTKRSSRGGPPVIRGCYPTAQFHLCTTFASCPNLDSLVFGGGVPVGAVLAVADVNPKSGRADSTRTSKYARLFLKYFLSEGVALGHGLSYGSLKADAPSFLENLPDIVEADRKASGKDREQEEQMRIAWRYQNQKQPPGASPEEQHRKHGFNLQKNLDPAKLSSVPTRSWTGCDGEGNPYRDLFASIRDDLSLLQGEGDPDPKKPKTVLRIGLESLGSLNFGDDARHTHLKTFLLAVRSLLRTHLGICVVTLDSDSFPSESDLKDVYECVDGVVELTAFNSQARESGDLKEYHGLLEVVKFPRFHRLTWEHNRGKYVFKSMKTKLTVEKIHLPPALGEEDSSSKKVTATDLEF